MPQMGLLAIMTAMADDVPAMSAADAALALSHFLNDFHERLNDEQAVAIMTIGAALWRQSAEHDDLPPSLVAELAHRH